MLFKLKNDFGRKQNKSLLAGLKITTRCNMQCVHCPFWRNKNPLNMDWEVFCRTVKKLYASGVRILIIEGGEPMLWEDKEYKKDIEDAINFAKNYFFYTAITTNGSVSFTDINPDIVFISIESIGDNYRKIRGNYLPKVLNNISNAKNKKIIINITISSLTLDDVIKTVKFLNDTVFGFTFQFFYPYENIDEKLKLSFIQRKEILEKIIEIKKQGFKILDSYAALKRMADNSWKCADYLVSSVEADGKIHHGCYLKGRTANISCRDCGFFAHCELSLAYRLNPGALLAAKRIFMD